MPTPIPPGLRLGVAEPQDAIAAFQRRGLLQPSFRWQDVFDDEHGRALAVAGVSRLDVLQIFQDELGTTLREGGSLADFGKRIRPQLAKKGFWGDVEVTDPISGARRMTRFDDARLRTIFDVNTRQSHAAGRWARIERSRDTMPLVMYRTAQDERVRASHAAWNGTVLPIDHPFWNTHFPPNGWRCRCRAFAVNQRDVDRRREAGERIKTEAPPERTVVYRNLRKNTEVEVPHGVDPGFGYNPGKLRDASLYDAAMSKAIYADPRVAAQVLEEALLDHPVLLSRKLKAFSEWVDAAMAQKGKTGMTFPLGFIRPRVFDVIQEQAKVKGAKLALNAALLSVRDEDVIHALRDGSRRGKPRKPIPETLYKRLPAMLLKEPEAVYAQGGNLIFVFGLADAEGRALKVAVVLNKEHSVVVDGERVSKTLTVARTLALQSAGTIATLAKALQLWPAEKVLPGSALRLHTMPLERQQRPGSRLSRTPQATAAV